MLGVGRRGRQRTFVLHGVCGASLPAGLRREGFPEGGGAADDGFHLVNGTCPYRKAAEISPLPCESDRKAIELLLGLDVEQLNRIVDGSPICEYLVRTVRVPADSIPLELIEMPQGVR